MIAKTFCSAPWFAIRLNWDGQFVPCCEFDIGKSEFCGNKVFTLHNSAVEEYLSSDYLQYIKQSLDSEQKIAECSRCWEKESSGLRSLRQISNDTATNNQGNNLDKTWVGSFLKRHSCKDHYLLSADIKLSNVCNFSCAMCSPSDSSKIFDQWKNQSDEFFVQRILEQRPTYFDDIARNYQGQRGYQHLKDILSYPIRNLKLLGGEPLLDKELFKILQSVDQEKKSQVGLHFVTNGSQNLINAYNQLTDYRSVTFSVSLEGIGAVQDYVRTGSDFASIEKNLLSAKQAGLFVSIHHTIQALSVFGIQDLVNWCNANGFDMTVSELDYPEYLSVSVLPADIKTKVLTNIKSERILNLINKFDYNPKKYAEFKQYINWFDRDKPTKISDIFPDLIR